MLYKIDDFESKTPSTIEYENVVLACGEQIKVYTIKNVHDLIQFIGYGKYKNCLHQDVYLRGQT